MLQIIQLETDEHRDCFRQLVSECLSWIYAKIEREFNATWDVSSDVDKTANNLSKFAPPKGRLLLANYDGKIVGCVGLIKINDDIAELKRMYVKPSYQKKGIGKALLTAIIEEATQIGYSKVFLDSPGFLKEAHEFYYYFGFKKIQPYPENDIPKQYYYNWLFMEKTLS